MRRRPFLLSLCVALCVALSLAGAAMAQSYADDVVQQLSGQGYSNISVETTFLGRVRILAYGAEGRREIILNPRTGEILRDLLVAAGEAGAKVTIVDHSVSGSGSGSGSGSDDGGNDDGDDSSGSGSGGDDRDDGDDNSGTGSGGGDRDDDQSRDND